MPPLQIGVVGLGHLGTYHVQNLLAIPDVDLIAVYDINKEKSKQINYKYGIPFTENLTELEEFVDAIILATPATSHYIIAKSILISGKDLFVEKPLCCTSKEAQQLINIAQANSCVLQVGHIERYNPGVVALKTLLREPKYIEFFRLSPFSIRGTDTSVVMDLMIHDIDLLLYLLGDIKPKNVVAHGTSVFTSNYDIVKAHFSFTNGIWAECTASRMSLEPKRRLRLFQKGELLDLDLSKPQLKQIRASNKNQILSINKIETKQGNPLKKELEDFIKNIQKRITPIPGGKEAHAAIELAEEILCSLEKHSTL